MSFNRTSIGSESFASSRRSWYAACLSSRKCRTPSSSTRASTSLAMAAGIPAADQRSQTARMPGRFSTRRVSRTSGFPKWPSSSSRDVSPSGTAKRSAAATRSSASVAWQYVRASMRRVGSSAMEPLQGRSRLPPELVQARFIHEHDIGGRDHVSEPPAQLAEVPRSDRFDREGIVQALASQHPLVARLRGRVDGDDHERLAERLSEHLELRPTAQAIDDDALTVDSRQRALCPDSESVGLPFGMRYAPDGGIRDGEASTLGFLADYVAHPDDCEPKVLRHNEDFFLPASRHAGDADHLHARDEREDSLKRFPRRLMDSAPPARRQLTRPSDEANDPEAAGQPCRRKQDRAYEAPLSPPSASRGDG